MELIIIVAISDNNVIGKDNSLLWHLPNDFKRFKSITSGFPIIMGRKTFESIGSKPLPKRENIVISSSLVKEEKNLFVVNSLEKAIEKASTLKKNKVFIIGGAQIYNQSIDIVDKLDITKVDASFEGDTYFPTINLKDWQLVSEEKHPRDEKHLFSYSFCIYKRK